MSDAQHPSHGPTDGLVVAVDGTSGSGKSSTCRGVAGRLGLAYLDTGAMYRAMTWWMLEHGVDVHDAAAVALRSGEATIVSGTDPQAPTIHVDGTDVSGPIRGEAVTGAVSPVATVPEVRERMVALQRATIEAATGGIVVEGRDIASHVWPAAQVKVYLTADPAARASRRALEEGGTDAATVEAVLRSRDAIDSGRATSPLVQVDGAAHLDTTHLTLDEVIEEVVALVRAVEVDA